MVKQLLEDIMAGRSLAKEDAEKVMQGIIDGKLTQAQIAGILVALKMKGENIEEIIGFVNAMRNNAIKFELDSYAIDTCGTGGDGKGTFNISTLVSVIAAAGGVKVAKHGNRSISSKSGSADVLTELGYDIEMSQEDAERCLEDTGFVFLFAPKYNQSMKNAAPVRKELGIRTVFNLMGPLIHPGDIKGQMIGIYDGELTHLVAEVLEMCGRERAMVVHGNDGLDEISISTTTKVSELRDGEIKDYVLDPRDYGFELAPIEAVEGGTPSDNMAIMYDILKGEKSPKRDIVVLNSAAALYVGKAVDSFEEGIKMAGDIIDSGKGLRKLEEIVEYNKGLKR